MKRGLLYASLIAMVIIVAGAPAAQSQTPAASAAPATAHRPCRIPAPPRRTTRETTPSYRAASVS